MTSSSCQLSLIFMSTRSWKTSAWHLPIDKPANSCFGSSKEAEPFDGLRMLSSQWALKRPGMSTGERRLKGLRLSGWSRKALTTLARMQYKRQDKRCKGRTGQTIFHISFAIGFVKALPRQIFAADSRG